MPGMPGSLARLADMQRREARLVRPIAHGAVHLGRKNDPRAAATTLREPATDDLLRHPLTQLPTVDIGSVNEVDAAIEGLVHDAKRVGLARRSAEVHGAQAETADFERGATEPAVFHRAYPTQKRVTKAICGGGA